MKRATVVMMVLGLYGCGSPVDEYWAGEITECRNDQFPDGQFPISPELKMTALLVLEGPVGMTPEGMFGTGFEGNGGTKDAWYASELKRAQFQGTRLRFRAASGGFIHFGATTEVDITRVELEKYEGNIRFHPPQGAPTHCKLVLQPR